VKRTLSDGQVRKGVKNVVRGKQHLLNVLWKDTPKGWGDWGLPPRVFTAVVGFGDTIGENADFYHRLLLKWSTKQRASDRPNMVPTSMYILPSFIGSLTTLCVLLDGPCNYGNQRYYVLHSYHNDINMCIQMFLWKIYNVLGGEPNEMPPFAFPEMKPVADFRVLQITKVAFGPDGTLTLHRNDKWKGSYRIADGPTKDSVHIMCDASSKPTMTGLLQTDLAAKELFVKRPSTVERYALVKWEPPASR
jgi:hypothetical protein